MTSGGRAPASTAPAGADLVDACLAEARALLVRNLVPEGILAATPGKAARERGYASIFARDAGVCVLAMLLSGDERLEHGAIASLDTLAAHQAANGQIPKFASPGGEGADFWYLGCIDATLWWLIAVDFARRTTHRRGLAQRWQAAERRSLAWLACQEHQRFYLLQQNEASDWADIMPRSGFVLYTNALWHYVKHRYGLAHREQTRHHFEHLFHPFSRDLHEYRRARLLAHYARRGARRRELYLSFVNFSFFGDEGDVFGNVLAVLMGATGDAAAERVMHALDRARIADPHPVRVVCEPIARGAPLWRAYMGRHQQNLEHQYHNGGIWPFVGGFWVMALAARGKLARARRELVRLAAANAAHEWRFTEWFHGRTLEPLGMAGQSWNAAAFLLAHASLAGRVL